MQNNKHSLTASTDGDYSRVEVMASSSPVPMQPTSRSLNHEPTPAELAHHAKDKARDVGYEHAAQFLLLIDQDAAASVISRLDNEEVIEICRTISRLSKIEPRSARHVIESFGIPASIAKTSSKGGPEPARRLLTAAFDSKRAQDLINLVLDPKSSS